MHDLAEEQDIINKYLGCHVCVLWKAPLRGAAGTCGKGGNDRVIKALKEKALFLKLDTQHFSHP